MKRSIIPVLLAAGALALAACGSNNNSSSSNTTASGGGGATTATTSASSGGATTTTAPSGATTTAPATAPVIHAAITLREDGSSLLFPYLEQVASEFHKANPKIAVNTGAGGSGLGISDAAAGNTSFGGSDAYLSSSDTSQYPGLINIPVAVSSQCIDYNLGKGFKNLKLNGAILDGMYTGSITNWDDSAIAKLNPGVKLPNLKVAPIHRVDSSGDTFLFTGFLSATNPSTWGTKIGQNTSVTWPSVSTAQSASGNPGMVQAAAKTKGSVAYIGISAQKDALAAGLDEAQLQNRAGKFLQPTTATVESAVQASASKVPNNLAVSLLYAPGANSYPIVNFEYIIVKTKQPNATQAKAIRTFLMYVINTKDGSSPTNLAADQFHALPMSIIPKVKSAISSIK